jgi:hypothetical protein
MTVWRGFLQKAAEQCFGDSALETVKLTIASVPEPRPAGWTNAGLSARESCEDLKAGYPYHG